MLRIDSELWGQVAWSSCEQYARPCHRPAPEETKLGWSKARGSST